MENNKCRKFLSLRSVFHLCLRYSSLAILTTVVLSGCNSGGGGEGGDSAGNNPPTNSTTAVVGSGGGTVSLPSGTSVTIDAGIVKDGTAVTITSEPAPASSSAEITPISPIVRITIPAGSFLQSPISGADGISLKIPTNAPANVGQQAVIAALGLPTSLSSGYKYIKVQIKVAGNAVVTGWTAYAKFTRDTADILAGAEVATVKISSDYLHKSGNLILDTYWTSLNLYAEFTVEQYDPNVPTAGQLFEVRSDGTFAPVPARVSLASGKLPLVLVHGIQVFLRLESLAGCDGNANAYQETWKEFGTNFYSDPNLSDKYALYTFSYQTDLGIAENGLRLATVLKDTFGEQQAVIVAHSMGGLVTRSALVHHANVGAKIGGLITLGTPHHGTVGVDKVAGWLDTICFSAMTSLAETVLSPPQGAKDLAWDNFDNQAGCGNDFLCGTGETEGLNTKETNYAKYIPYVGALGSDLVSCATTPLMCAANSIMDTFGGGLLAPWSGGDGVVPIVSARFADMPVNGQYPDKPPLRTSPRVYAGIHHSSIYADTTVFTKYPDGSAGGLTKDLLDFYDSLTPPTVNATAITDGATGVATNSAVSVTFSKALDVSTINTSTFTLNGPSGLLAGTVTYDATTNTAIFTPSTALGYSTTYTATITTGVKDLAGNPLASNYSWSFTTNNVTSSGFEGIWNGSAVQINNTSWTIKVTIASGQYSIDYPSLSCGGYLVLLQESTNSIEFREYITYGTSSCVNNGKTVLVKTGANSAEYQWYYPDGSKGATGTVTRQ